MRRIGLLLLILITAQQRSGLSNTSSIAFTTHQNYDEVTSFVDSLDNYVNLWIYNDNINYAVRFSRLDSLQEMCISLFGTNSQANAFILHKMGVLEQLKVYSGDEQRYSAAIALYEKALQIRLGLNNERSIDLTKEIINGYNMISMCFYESGDLPNSLVNIKKALNYADAYYLRDSFSNALLKLNIQAARTYTKIGDYDLALDHYKTIINYSTNDLDLKDRDAINLWKIRADMECAAIYAINLYQPKLALSFLKHARVKLNSLNLEDKEIFMANIFNKMGLSYYRLDDYDSAIFYYKKAIAIHDIRNNEFELSGNYLNISLAYKKKGQIDVAEKYLIASKELFLNTNQEYKLASVYDNLGDLEFEKGNIHKALEYDNLAIKYIMPKFNPKSIYDDPVLDSIAISDKVGLVVSLSSKTASFLQLFNLKDERSYLESAYKSHSLADRVISLMRSEFQAEASKISLASFAKPVYEQGIESCFQLYQLIAEDSLLEKAFMYSEESRAIVLLDAVRKTRASSRVDPDLIAKEHKLNLKVNYFEKMAALQDSETESEELNYILDSLTIYRRRRAAVVDTIKVISPEYHKIIFEEATTSIAEVKGTLKKDQSFIEYFVGDSSLYTFVINRDTILFLKMDQPDSIRKWSNNWLTQIKQQDLEILHSGNQLYRSLIEPISNQLQENVILVPDDVLNLVSFDALVTQPPPSDNAYLPDPKSYLIYDHQLSYAFSASTLMENQGSTRIKAKRFLGIAPEMKKGFNLLGERFDKLDHNVEQVEQAGRLFPDKYIIESAEAMDSFSALAPEYNVIHCATHALANNKDGDLSFILFGENESDVLYAKDLYAVKLDADMVVLSACQTSAGELNRGEGVISLARAFTYAGASSIVTSLWNVREKINNEIIYEFYQELKKGKSKDEALRMAKRNYMGNISMNEAASAHPYFWAPLIVMGDTHNTFQNRQNAGILILAALIMFTAILFYLKRGK